MTGEQLSVKYDPETEKYLLAAILDTPAVIWEVRQIVRAADFQSVVNATVYEAMVAVSDAAKACDAPTVNAHIIRAGKDHIVSATYAYELMNLGIVGVQWVGFGHEVREHGERRRLLEEAGVIAEIAANGGDGGDLLEQAIARLDGLRGGVLRQSRPIGEAFTGLVEKMKTNVPYTPTPWPSLNAMIGGIRAGAMYTVAGASGGGKSIFGLQLATHIAEMGGRVGYVSLEMSEEDLLKRIISMMQDVHQSALVNHELSEDGWRSVMEAETYLKTLPLEVFDRGGTQYSDIVGFARALHRKGNMKLLVVDYHGLTQSPPGASTESRTQLLNQWANGYKQLARELGIAVVVLEQFNRDSTKRQNARPVITDLRGTAALEHAADCVILLHRVMKKVGGKEVLTNDIEFIAAKNRQGQQGYRVLVFDGAFSRISQKEHEHTQLYD
ncbi:replicative DNA helicase [Pseudomonas sp.]|uniref:replicative DNA helicase n=1 Tax=Pseudomonas sp. TaxID=306 RepID=UPI002625BF1C|nr:replicative DNA helicase [Pseudomonas sp.]